MSLRGIRLGHEVCNSAVFKHDPLAGRLHPFQNLPSRHIRINTQINGEPICEGLQCESSADALATNQRDVVGSDDAYAAIADANVSATSQRLLHRRNELS